MEITEAQYARIAPYLPVQRGNVRLSNLQVLNAILYVAEHGCKWRGLPTRYGNWHTIYMRMNRWSKSGVLDRVFEQLQRQRIVRLKLEAVSLDSTIVKVHPDGTGALKKRASVDRPIPRRLDHQASYGCRGCPDGRDLLAVGRTGARRAGGARAFAPSRSPARQPGAGDGPRLRRQRDTPTGARPRLHAPWVPPLKTRRDPWLYDREIYKRRNEIERLFRRLKGFRRIFSRFEKLDALFLGFVQFALIYDALR